MIRSQEAGAEHAALRAHAVQEFPHVMDCSNGYASSLWTSMMLTTVIFASLSAFWTSASLASDFQNEICFGCHDRASCREIVILVNDIDKLS